MTGLRYQSTHLNIDICTVTRLRTNITLISETHTQMLSTMRVSYVYHLIDREPQEGDIQSNTRSKRASQSNCRSQRPIANKNAFILSRPIRMLTRNAGTIVPRHSRHIYIYIVHLFDLYIFVFCCLMWHVQSPTFTITYIYNHVHIQSPMYNHLHVQSSPTFAITCVGPAPFCGPAL